jgi:DNA-binding GntR family transcriptional regulator
MSQPSEPPFQTAEEYAYQQLRREILAGDIPGGTPLNQDEIAARLRVSRTPVRQAFLRLGSEGLITNRPNRGSVVTSLSARDILELFEIRSVLEGFAASLASRQLDKRAHKTLETRAAALEAAQVSSKRWVDMHDEFHHFITVLADRPRLAENVHAVRQRVVPYLRLYLTANKGTEIRGHEHVVLTGVLTGGDPDLAERAMREHVMSAAMAVVEFVRGQEQNVRDVSSKSAAQRAGATNTSSPREPSSMSSPRTRNDGIRNRAR